MGRRQQTAIPQNVDEASRGVGSKLFNGIKHIFILRKTVQYLQNENINDKLYI